MVEISHNRRAFGWLAQGCGTGKPSASKVPVLVGVRGHLPKRPKTWVAEHVQLTFFSCVHVFVIG